MEGHYASNKIYHPSTVTSTTTQKTDDTSDRKMESPVQQDTVIVERESHPSSTSITIKEFWSILEHQNKDEFKKIMKFLLEEYGTALHCNRFAIGNCHEYAISDLIRATHLETEVLQNAKRIDIHIKSFRKFSIKYSSGGNIKLHNSNNIVNVDISMADTLLVTPTRWWFLEKGEIEKTGIILSNYLKNTGDGLELMSSIFKELKAKEYPFTFEFDIGADKKACKNKEINQIIYDFAKFTLASLPSETAPSV
jgi:hypothetical protein